ncbi:MAG: 4Fe-4S dicluster domain-containing protein [Cyclobacteriaceae bacterium]|nr:4Fe-4S dicluster domain-containing protein [Cyclobacteriaceae bacterium]MCH8515827.1 4Fe-4S dicluster domain-containing protein [Cyclobacteriaceae bacterium]
MERSKKGANNNYFGNIKEAVTSLLTGIGLTMKHIGASRKRHLPTAMADTNFEEVKDGLVTIDYPHNGFPVPDNGRYKLHNEIDDCIVCDKCAKVCPVNCIDIEPIRSAEEIGKTSDGTSKRLYAAKFDIDMAKCCFCGLCTTVCPTECLTMTKSYDYSTFDIRDHLFNFSEMTDQEVSEKQQDWEKAQAEKAAAKKQTSATPSTSPAKKAAQPKPKAAAPVKKDGDTAATSKKAAFKPKMPVRKPKKDDNDNKTE